ncbi:M56 family metallopeptidase [Acutalibacter sp. 1XD8-36]|uniref:M56 family metallopeptidase n=1 Tax=Acutalibacter sp. 1XD8-36 TaxID=2320852 RepID=UPI002612CFE8|nr:M56 family metallopeptidase [Acutalibacter sp. 1XD8-36]
MNLLQMSVSGGAMAAAVLLVRALALHRLPKRLFPALWAIVMIRLLVPFSLPASCSVYSLLSRPAPVVVYSPRPTSIPLHPSALEEEITEVSVLTGGAAHSANPWHMIWLTGLLVFAGYFAMAYIKCRLEFREALPVRNAYIENWLLVHQLRRPIVVRQSDKISAPLTYGILRPVILLPKSTDWTDIAALGYVLAHEWTHIRRFDSLFKLILTAGLCVHWFNPMVWVMVFFANRDIELACDESVLSQLGRDTRSGYAMALIHMEEAKSGLAMMGSHFSKTPIEERIKSIMKMKRNSIAALALAVSLIGGTAALFATSAKAEAPKEVAHESTYDLVDKDSLVSYTGADGIPRYSWDGGETWKAMTDEEFAAAFPGTDVEWWTAEEYAAWLEEEKKGLQDIIGSKGWTPSTGWFTWTQEMVAEAISEYEEILAMIEDGYLVSKTVDGAEDTMLVMNPLDRVVGSADWEGAIEEKDDSNSYANDDFDYTSLFDDYMSCGLDFNNSDGSLYWKGQRVRIFVDGAELGEGFVSVYEHYDPDGAIDVHAVRERVDNGDGSYSLMGPLVRLEEFTPDRMFLDALEGQKYVGAEIQYEAEQTAIRLEPYTPYGLTYKTDTRTGELAMEWNGKPVRSLFDAERQLWTANSLGGNGLNLEAVYENGMLTGLRESEEKGFVESGVAIHAEAAAAEGSGGSSGETIAGRMEQYAPFGVSYKEQNGRKIIGFKGQVVNSFADIRPDGSVFSVEADDGGEIDLVTVYDRHGRLSGIKAAEA